MKRDLTFRTSVTTMESKKVSRGVYTPSGILPDGSFIHEWPDNVDINTETVDGKDTYHSMARVVFQKQSNENYHRKITIKKLQNRSLPVTPEIESFIKCIDFNKRMVRPEPVHYRNALEMIKKNQNLPKANGRNILVSSSLFVKKYFSNPIFA